MPYNRESVASRLRQLFPGRPNLDRNTIHSVGQSNPSLKSDVAEYLKDSGNRTSRGVYDITPHFEAKVHAFDLGDRKDVIRSLEYSTHALIPAPIPNYCEFGNHDTIQRIIQKGVYMPTFVSGLSGCGKTTGIVEACSRLKRGLIRCNITAETDEDDLLGGYRLVDGRTVFQFGPVVEAMIGGHILLLDEVDLGTSRIMCLQPVFDSRRVFLKKINLWVSAAPGFNIFATANTKGQGSESGKFIGTNVMNEAFLDRFAITLDQDYPEPEVEVDILNRNMKSNGVEDPIFAQNLVRWAGDIRKAYNEGGITDLISTRRLVQIVDAFGTFHDRKLAIEMCLNRFNPDSRAEMIRLYGLIDQESMKAAKVEKIEDTDVIIIPKGKMPIEDI